MEILLDPTSNKLMVERFYTSARNPVKEILLKLNLPDHRILKDGGEVALGYKPMGYSVLLPILVCGLDTNSPDELLEDSMQVNKCSLYTRRQIGGSGVIEMLKKFGLEDSKPMKTPMSSDTKLTNDEECESVDSTKYREFAQILDIPCEGACVFTDKWSLDELAYGVPTDGPYQTNSPSPDEIICILELIKKDGYGVLVVRTIFFKIYLFKLQNARLLLIFTKYSIITAILKIQ
ncbi:hypothetical protein Tco_0903126 [Tanacetum coccineum]